MLQFFTNIDAMWLARLAEDFAQADPDQAAIHARLILCAQHLQGLDERAQALSHTGENTYAAGYAAAEARMRRRSNVLTNPEGEDAKGQSVLDQINQRVAQGNLTRVAMGERALDDAPDKFNGPVRKQPQAVKPLPAVSLDLDFLNSL